MLLLLLILITAIIILKPLYKREAQVSLFQLCINPTQYYVDAYGDIDCKEVLRYAQR
jgi:hypothetical protein